MDYYIPRRLPKSFLQKKKLHPVLQVPIRPIESGKQIYCLDNVESYLSLNSGSIQYGWIFSMLGSVIIKLHGHAVVRTGNAELVCVTPPETALDHHNFVPDDSVEDLLVNKRLPTKAFSLVNDKTIESIVALENQLDRARLEGDRFGFEKVALEKQRLASEFINAVRKHTGRNDPCYCGSGRKNKQCCQ